MTPTATGDDIRKVRVLNTYPKTGAAPTLGLTLPAAVLRKTGWDVGDHVLVTVQQGGAVVVLRRVTLHAHDEETD